MTWAGFVRSLGASLIAALSLCLAVPSVGRGQLPDAPPAPDAAPAPEAAPEPTPTPVPPPPPGSDSAPPDAAPPPPSLQPAPTYPELSPPPGGYDTVQPRYGYRPQAGLQIPPRIAARLRTLETDLNLLSARGGGRIADGVISLVAGGAFFTIAAFVDDPLFRSLLFMTAGVATGRGLVELLVVPDPQELAIEYSHMPMATVEQVRDRLGYGEDALEHLAHRGRIARMLDGSIAIVSGAVTIGVFVARPPCPFVGVDCKFKDDPINYVVLVGGGISIIGGLVGLLVRSEAERRWDAYRKLRARLREEGEAQGTGTPVELALPAFAPLRRGAAISWGMRF